MSENSKTYNSYSSDNLDTGYKLKIEHTVYSNFDKLDISDFIQLSVDEVQGMYEISADTESFIFEKLCEAVSEWENQAGHTLLLEKALEYIQLPVTKHTANEWRQNEYGSEEISNKVYKMVFQVDENIEYNHKTGKREVISWEVSWSLRTNSLASNFPNQKIAGQHKKFNDKATLEKYVEERKSAYANLFIELSPPIPKELVRSFTVNNQLLQGYITQSEQAQKKPSALDKLNVAKNTVEKTSSNKDNHDKKTPSDEYCQGGLWRFIKIRLKFENLLLSTVIILNPSNFYHHPFD